MVGPTGQHDYRKPVKAFQIAAVVKTYVSLASPKKTL
jgi:hypothetical protein